MPYFGAISAKEHYALRLALWLAKSYSTQQSVTLSEISRHENISLKYLEQLILPFKKAGWIKSRRGRNGGYVMVKNPKLVSLKAIVSLIEGRLQLIDCATHNQGRACALSNHCPSKKAWSKVQTALDQTMAGISLAKLLT
ncbi:MAG: Rrf2 family transcriptional regulator [Patescibacteria group bacterium]|jgi:Rrf2 family protein